VTVAVLDTGIYASHPDLQGPGGSRVIGCVDFSSEAGGQAGCKDTFGHGTFMAGLIAGNGASSSGKYMGAAPEANLVSVKVAGFDGSADVSHVLAGIQWVVAHQAQYGIRVLNLSLGSDSSQDYRLSPLDFAVERAWKAGIAVVVSAGNTGPGAHTITKPADDPYVITVGAENDEGSIAVGDDQVPVFSGRGPTRSNGFTKPDIVAPGVHTVSLRDPGSAIDQKYGASATIDGSYFRGTGTSMSAATVSGVVAQMLQADPTLTPDQVKYRLMQTAQPIADANPNNAGRGVVDAYGAATSSLTGSANLGLTPSSGLGSIEADRGSLHVSATTPVGQAALSGEFVALSDPADVSLTNPKGLVPWVGLSYATTGWDATTWNATTWNATTWNATVDATTWNATTWNATTWYATTWNATTWNATTWNGTTWNDSDWNATTWNTTNWDATTWNATTWNSAWYAAAWN
jgi:serine protease AprX